MPLFELKYQSAVDEIMKGRPCVCGHYRLDHEFSEDCSMCWKCGCIEFSPQEKQS